MAGEITVMKKVLIFTDYYWPGFKSGALRSVVNLVDRLGDRIEFYVITRNHDGGDPRPYTTVKAHAWNSIGRAQVYYADPAKLTTGLIRKLVNEVSPDAVYLNSCFARMSLKFFWLRRLGRLPEMPVVLAPEGELMRTNLGATARKKRGFCAAAFPLGLYRDLVWKVASEPEFNDLRRYVGNSEDVYLAPSMPPRMILPDHRFEDKPEKRSGEMRVLWISRILETKNLKFALQVLSQVRGQVVFDIYGPMEDPSYWAKCQPLLRSLPANVRANYCGEVVYEKVADTFSGYHFFLFPTKSENFGFVIVESMAAGTPVLISDKTPWRDLAVKKLGWDMSLVDEAAWRATLQQCVDMGPSEFAEWSQATRNYAVEWLDQPEVEASNYAVLQHALYGNRINVPRAGTDLPLIER
jgi:glycosyltransferase involved in cell wall biosynthesis